MNIRGIFIAFGVAAVLASGSLPAHARTISVDCNGGDTIATALDRARSGDVIAVSGACTENVMISKDRVSLIAQPGATLTAADASNATLTIDGSHVVVADFASITGGLFGIVVHRNGSATIRNNSVTGASSHGLVITDSAYAEITGNAIDNNGTDTAASFGQGGIVVGGAAAADIFNNSVAFNARHGVGIAGSASATLDGNTITDNGRHGIILIDSSFLGLSEVGGTANFLARNGNNGLGMSGAGIGCFRFGTYQVRVVQTLGAGADANATGAIVSSDCRSFDAAGDPNF